MTLDEAWEAAESALPVQGRIACQRRPDQGQYEAWAQSDGDGRRALGYGYGVTPSAALQALIAVLRGSHGDTT